jgi:6-phosphogluconolactonase
MGAIRSGGAYDYGSLMDGKSGIRNLTLPCAIRIERRFLLQRFARLFALFASAVLPWSALLAAPARAQPHTPAASRDYFVYVGTYTGAHSKGIYSYRFHARTGQLTPIGLAAELPNPSFLIADRANKHLYAATEMGAHGPKDANGAISSYAIDPRTGSLRLLNTVDSSGGGTCHLALDRTGKVLIVVNYASGSVASFAVNADGTIGRRTGFDMHTGSSVDPERQPSPHPHEVVFSPDNRFAFVPDLGTDRIYIYRLDLAHQSFSPADPAFVTVAAGVGPRHLLFGPGARFAYLVCEMGSRVIAFSYDAVHGALHPVQTISTLPSDYTGPDASAEIHIDRAGRHIYASNRGHNSITVFSVDPRNGELKMTQNTSTLGDWPRNFVLDPTGKYLIVADQNSNQLVTFTVDPHDGHLTPTGNSQQAGSPVCILFVPAVVARGPA